MSMSADPVRTPWDKHDQRYDLAALHARIDELERRPAAVKSPDPFEIDFCTVGTPTIGDVGGPWAVPRACVIYELVMTVTPAASSGDSSWVLGRDGVDLADGEIIVGAGDTKTTKAIAVPVGPRRVLQARVEFVGTDVTQMLLQVRMRPAQ